MTKNIIILILILAFIGVVVFLDVPGVQGTLNLREQVKKQREKFSEKQELLAKMEKLNQLYEENQENLEKVNYILPSGLDMPNLIVQLEALVFGGGLILEEIEFSRTKDILDQDKVQELDYKILTISLKLIGTYPSFENFLKTLEENMRLMDVVSIDFSSQSEESFELFNFSLQIKTYYQ